MNSQAADPLLARVRKLLAKAEDAGVTAAEAQALTAKAAELMAKYGIDRARLAAERPETDRPADRVIDVGNPWARVQAHLLCGLASALRCQCVILPAPARAPGSTCSAFPPTSSAPTFSTRRCWSRCGRAWPPRRFPAGAGAPGLAAQLAARASRPPWWPGSAPPSRTATSGRPPRRPRSGSQHGAGPRRPRPGHPPQHRAGLPASPASPR